jgi:RNA polymerase sigma-70 factor (ECF subfamily)
MSTSGEPRALLSTVAEAREKFMELVAELRPELHRYCARMTGSVFDGEDIVQETLAKALFALPELEEPLPLRPWLFRIAHNTAMDFLRRYEHKHVELVAEPPAVSQDAETPLDPSLVEAALFVFVTLPPVQRSALVLKDVLGHSLDETATTMGTTVSAVKAALVRARANVAHASKTRAPSPKAASPEEMANLKRYAELFNARNWDGLRAQLGEEARLDLVSRWQRRGPSAAQYFSRYAEKVQTENLRAEAGIVDGVPALALFRSGSDRPAYFVRLTWRGDEVALIRDFHYVPYVADSASFSRSAE